MIFNLFWILYIVCSLKYLQVLQFSVVGEVYVCDVLQVCLILYVARGLKWKNRLKFNYVIISNLKLFTVCFWYISLVHIISDLFAWSNAITCFISKMTFLFRLCHKSIFNFQSFPSNHLTPIWYVTPPFHDLIFSQSYIIFQRISYSIRNILK